MPAAARRTTHRRARPGRARAWLALAVPARAPVQIELFPADGESGDRFGHGVALEGDTLAARAPLVDEGAVFVFVREARAGASERCWSPRSRPARATAARSPSTATCW